VKPVERLSSTGLAPEAPGAVSEPRASRGLTDAEVRALDPKTFAARFRRQSFCEQAARALRPVSAGKAWEVLVACVDKGNFTLLDRLVEDPWLEDLRTRPDASRLIVKVIAARGGDEIADGSTLREHKVPLFALESAVRQPGIFRGQLLVLRARIADIRAQNGETTIRLHAKGFMDPSDVHILGRLAKHDPFLERGRDLVLVARFEGLEEKPGDGARQGEWIAVLSVIGYSEPAAAVIE
jgi:hypothetical protein